MELPSSGTLLCGPFLPATPSPESKCSHSCAPRKAKGTKPAEGLRPWRATRGTPIFRAALVQTGLRPPSTSFRVGNPTSCTCRPCWRGPILAICTTALRTILNELAWANQLPELANLLRREDICHGNASLRGKLPRPDEVTRPRQ